MNDQFGRFWIKLVVDAGYKPVQRGTNVYWRKPGERSILYDIPEAVCQIIESGEFAGVSNLR